MSHFDALGVARLDIDVICLSAQVAAKVLTISDRTCRHHLEVRVASVDKLLIHSVALVRVHDTCSVHFRVGEVLQHPLPRRLLVLRVDDQVKAGRFEKGERIGSDRSGTEVSVIL